MHIGGMIPVLLIVAFFVVLTWWQRSKYSLVNRNTKEDKSVSQESITAVSTWEKVVPVSVLINEVWWKHLSSLHQLKLAFYLAGKALPIWERFAALQVVSYRAVSAGDATIIEMDMLKKALYEINHHAQDHFPGSDSDITKINEYYKLFIGPVLALKDGIWVCAYPVKKLVLSVYYILLGIVEQHNTTAHENYFAEAINAALECIELSRLYTPEEMASILAAYRSGL